MVEHYVNRGSLSQDNMALNVLPHFLLSKVQKDMAWGCQKNYTMHIIAQVVRTMTGLSFEAP